MKLVILNKRWFAVLGLVVGVSLSGCCSGGSCGLKDMLGQRDIVDEAMFSSNASEGTLEKYRAEVADAASTRVAATSGLMPSWLRSGSAKRSCATST